MESPSTEWIETSPSRSKISKDPDPRYKVSTLTSPKNLECNEQSEIELSTDRNSGSKNGGGLEQRLKKEMERTAHLRETIRKAKERIARLEYVKRSDRKLNKAFARSTNSVYDGISLRGFSPQEKDKRKKKHKADAQKKICGVEDDTKRDDSPSQKPPQMDVLELSVERLTAKTRELQKTVETASLATVLLRSSSASEKASVWEDKLVTASERLDALELMMNSASDRFSEMEEHIRSGDERASKEQQGVRRAHQKLLDRLGRLEAAAERLADSNVEQTHRLKSLEEAIKAAEQRRADEVSQQEAKMSLDAPRLSDVSERLELLEQRVKSYHTCSNEKFQDLRNTLRVNRESDCFTDSKKAQQLMKLEEAATSINEKLARLERSTTQEKEAMHSLERSAKNAFARTSTLERAVVIMQEAVLDKFLPLLEKLLPLQEMQMKEMAERLELHGGGYLPRQKYLLESIAPLVVEAQQAIRKATSSTEQLVKRRIAHLEDTTNSLEHFLDQTDEEQRWQEIRGMTMEEQFGALGDTVNHLTRRLIHEQHTESGGAKIRQISSTNCLELSEKQESLESLLETEKENLEDLRKNFSETLPKLEKGKSMKVEKIYQRIKHMNPKDKLLDDYIHDMYDLSESLSPGEELSTGTEITADENTENPSLKQVSFRNKELLLGSTFERTLEELVDEEMTASEKKITDISCLHRPENTKEIGRQDQLDMDLTQILAEKGHFDLDDI